MACHAWPCIACLCACLPALCQNMPFLLPSCLTASHLALCLQTFFFFSVIGRRKEEEEEFSHHHHCLPSYYTFLQLRMEVEVGGPGDGEDGGRGMGDLTALPTLGLFPLHAFHFISIMSPSLPHLSSSYKHGSVYNNTTPSSYYVVLWWSGETEDRHGHLCHVHAMPFLPPTPPPPPSHLSIPYLPANILSAYPTCMPASHPTCQTGGYVLTGRTGRLVFWTLPTMHTKSMKTKRHGRLDILPS